MEKKIYLIIFLLIGHTYFNTPEFNSQLVTLAPSTDAAIAGVNMNLMTILGALQGQSSEDITSNATKIAKAKASLTVLKNINERAKKVKAIADSVQNTIGFVKDFKSYKKIYTLIENFSCVSKEFHLFTTLADQTGNCHFDFNYEMGIINYDLAFDLVESINKKGNLNHSEQATALEKVIIKLEKANEIMSILTNQAKMSLREEFKKVEDKMRIKQTSSPSDEINCSLN